MTPEQKEIVWRFIKHLNRLSRGPQQKQVFLEARELAEDAASPEKSHREQEAAMVRVAILIGEYDP